MRPRESHSSRNGDLAKIHIAKKQLGLDDETYRALVARVSADFRPESPVDSAGALTAAERQALLQELRRLGYQAGPPQGEQPLFGKTDEPHVKKLFACANQILRDGAIAPADPARWLRKFTKRLTGIEDPRWLTAIDCNKVIEALKAWHRRLDERAAQKAANGAGPSPIVKKMAGEVLARISDPAADPRTGTRRFIALLSAQSWSSPEIARSVAELIRTYGERAHRELAQWNYRAARKELLLLLEDVAELEPGICQRLKVELNIGEDEKITPRGPRSHPNEVNER